MQHEGGGGGGGGTTLLTKLASRIATSVGKSKSVVLHELYGSQTCTLSEPMLRQYCQGAYHFLMSFISHGLNILCVVTISVWNVF